MLERFKEGVEVSHKGDESPEEKNDKRTQAIEEHLDNKVNVPRDSFINYLKDNGGEKKDELIEKVKQIDFSNANPRNKKFMNELAFAGGSLAEGFLETFGLEKETALEKYQNQLQVIEQKEDGQPSRFFVGKFHKGKLKKLSPFKDNREELQQKIEEIEQKRVRENELKKNNEHKISLERQKEE